MKLFKSLDFTAVDQSHLKPLLLLLFNYPSTYPIFNQFIRTLTQTISNFAVFFVEENKDPSLFSLLLDFVINFRTNPALAKLFNNDINVLASVLHLIAIIIGSCKDDHDFFDDEFTKQFFCGELCENMSGILTSYNIPNSLETRTNVYIIYSYIINFNVKYKLSFFIIQDFLIEILNSDLKESLFNYLKEPENELSQVNILFY